MRFLSEGWYQTFSEQGSGTKKFEKTHRMVRIVEATEDPDQFEHFRARSTRPAGTASPNLPRPAGSQATRTCSSLPQESKIGAGGIPIDTFGD